MPLVSITRRTLWTATQIVFVVLALAFAGWALGNQWISLRSLTREIHVAWIPIAASSLLVSFPPTMIG